MMKRLFVLVILALGLLNLTACGNYNAMQGKEERVFKAFSDIQAQEQRRMDLINQLVPVVKGYAAHENATLTNVIEARANASKITIQANDLGNAQKMVEYQKAQNGLAQAMGKLMMLTEKYPNLKADKHFSDLMTQIEGCENRIGNARQTYNKEVQEFNSMIRQVPNNFINGMFGQLTRKEPFKGDEGSHKAPDIKM